MLDHAINAFMFVYYRALNVFIYKSNNAAMFYHFVSKVGRFKTKIDQSAYAQYLSVLYERDRASAP